MPCAFGNQLLTSYNEAVHLARVARSTPKKQALADVALMAYATHQRECSACGSLSVPVRTLPGILRQFSLLSS